MGEFSLKRPDDKFPRYRKAAWRLIRKAVWTTSYCQVPKVANSQCVAEALMMSHCVVSVSFIQSVVDEKRREERASGITDHDPIKQSSSSIEELLVLSSLYLLCIETT